VQPPSIILQTVRTWEAGELFNAYSGFVAQLAFRLLGSDSDIDDVVQEVFLGAVRGLGAVRDARTIKGWLATLTVRHAGRRLRRKKIAIFFGLGADTFDQTPSGGASPEQVTLARQLCRVLNQLPVNDRLAWTLRHIEGEQLESVAALCVCSLATAKRRIAAAQLTIDRNLKP
jgi:RNA polymerase sigma-70 factor, ECF subfamily